MGNKRNSRKRKATTTGPPPTIRIRKVQLEDALARDAAELEAAEDSEVEAMAEMAQEVINGDVTGSENGVSWYYLTSVTY